MPAEPETLQSSAASTAKDINDYLNHYISVADAKAGALAAMAVLTSVAPSLFVGDSPTNYLQWTVKIAFAFHLLTLALCGVIVFPRKPSRGDSVVFWEDVARSPDVQDYQIRFIQAIENNFTSHEYAAQNYYISLVLSKKYYWLRLAMVAYGIGVLSICALLYWPIVGKP